MSTQFFEFLTRIIQISVFLLFSHFFICFSFILFLHKNRIQYVTIYDIKKQDRYKNILLYIYKNANTTERWLYDMATFVYDGEVLRCKIY